jgi:protoporphyrinogen oxidase
VRAGPRVVVAGAGPAGLFAAKTLLEGGASVTVVEREDRVGGLAAADQVDGNAYEGGVHHFHAADRFVFDVVSGLLGDRLLAVEKSARIRFGDGYRRYPLEFFDIVRAMPLRSLASCCAGLAWQKLRNRFEERSPADGEQALIQLYGGPLYRAFFRDFTTGYWGLPPSELSAAFIRKKMPRLSAFDGAQRALRRIFGDRASPTDVERATARETLYSTAGGAQEIFDAIAGRVRQLGGEIRLGAPLESVRLRGPSIASVSAGGEAIDGVDFVVSTVPLPTLVSALEPAPEKAVRDSAGRLAYKPLTVLGLLIRKERALEALYVYFRGRSFHRVGEPKSSGLRVNPDGHTILVAELTRPIDIHDAGARAAALETAVRELAEDGILGGPSDVVGHHFLHRTHAYPVFRKGFEEDLERVQHSLQAVHNLVSTGRQGGFLYPNMHQAMRMGHEAARKALARCEAARKRGSADDGSQRAARTAAPGEGISGFRKSGSST